MSYVRWTTPISLPEGVDHIDYYLNSKKYWHLPTSDFYIYDHVGGYVSVNMAGNRHRPSRPFEGPCVIEVDPETHSGRLNPAWLAWLDEGREAIDHPAAGHTFEFEDMADAIDKVEQLIAEGFLAPAGLLDALRAELAAQGIEARSDETPQAAQPEGREPDGEAMRPDSPTTINSLDKGVSE